ncbi:MAG: ribulose bisphosphate carboxylase small subunit [Vulcanimicrobiaceae bacterium]
MKITQGTFSYLPPLSDEQIAKQVQYSLDKGWAIAVEYTDDPHPRNSYWEMDGQPKFDRKDAAGIMDDIRKSVADHPFDYVKVSAYDSSLGRQTTALSFIVHRPPVEKGFRVERTTYRDRQLLYKIHPYSAEIPHGERYRNGKTED